MAAHETISDRLLRRLRDEIVAGTLAEGSLHSIYALAERFEVSRTPVRDAVLRLADAGMVTIERNRGVRVRGIGVAEVRAIFEVRLMLEVPAARFAAAHRSAAQADALAEDLAALRALAEREDAAAYVARDIVLHERMLDVLGNPRLSAQVRALRETTLTMDASTFGRSRSLVAVQIEHRPIVDAVIAQDSDAAAAAMREHLTETGLLLMHQVAAGTGESVPAGWPSPLIA